MSETELLSAVRAAAGSDFDVLGEIARDGSKTVVFLARDLQSKGLVVLKLIHSTSSETGQDEYVLEVMEKLDSSVPDIENYCSRCQSKLRRWARFCTQCGLDVSGIGPSSGENLSRDTLRNAVYAAAASEFDILGEMPRAEGGGLVYFGRKRDGGDIVALRLQQETDSEYALDVTRVLKPMEPSPQARSASQGHVEITGVNRPRPRPTEPPVSQPSPSLGPPMPSTPPPSTVGKFDIASLRRSIESNPNPVIVGAFVVIAASLLAYVVIKVFK
jgi:hypothetical protein